ncbi:MAG: hypothetical protein V4498_00995, partial [candidate division FCPU426 bacterium]
MSFHKFCVAVLGLVLTPLSASAASPLVSITKFADNFTPKVLDTFRYSIVVDNTGSTTATASTVTDIVPSGLTVMAISPPGTQTGNTITWNLGDLSCHNQVVTLTAIADTAGSWGLFTDVTASDDTWATSLVSGSGASTDSNWFIIRAISGYAVNSITSVKVYYEWHSNSSTDTISTSFSNDGDLATKEGTASLALGKGQASDVMEVWDITAAGGPWTFNKLQNLAVYTEHSKGSGSNHTVWLDKIHLVVGFQSCGTSVWFDAKVTNALKTGDIVNNSATLSGSNFGSANSANVSVTVKGPLLGVTKTAQPSVAAQGDTVTYTIAYKNQVSGLSLFDDFGQNYGAGTGIVGLSSDQQLSSWTNANGNLKFSACGYSRLWRTDVSPFSDGAVSMDFQISVPHSGTAATALMFLNQVNAGNAGKFYKSKVYLGGDGYYYTDVQTSNWDQVCGNAKIAGSNTPAWRDAWHNITVVIKNYVFQVYIDSVLTFTCNDPTAFIRNPGVPGIYNDGDCTTYDNYRIGDDLPAYNVTIWDTLDPCMTYVSSTPAATVSGNLISWNLGTLQGAQSGTVTYKASISGSCANGSSVPNIAKAGSSNSPIATSLNAPVSVVLPIAKSADKATASVGENVTYTLLYTATGGGTVFTDDFSATSWAGKWITQTNKPVADWATAGGAGGVLDVNGNIADQFTATATYGRDGAQSSDIYLGENQTNGLMFGYQGGKYYYVSFFCGYNANDDQLRLYYFDGTTAVLKDQSGLMQIDPTNGSASTGSTVISTKVVRAGKQFAVYIGGVYKYTLTDSANALPGDGLQGYNELGGDWRYDNYRWEPGYKARITVTDTVPANMIYMSSSGCAGSSSSYSGGIVTWTLADMSPGQTCSLTMLLKVSPTASGTIYNTAYSHSLGSVNYSSNIVPVDIIASGSPTNSPSPTLTRTPTWSPTPSPSASPSNSPSSTATISPSFTATLTASPTATGTPTATPSSTFSPTRSFSNTPTVTPTPTQSFTFSNSPTPSSTPTATPTYTSTPTNSPSPTYSNSPTPSATPTQSFTFTGTRTYTDSPTTSQTATSSVTFSGTKTFTDSPTASMTSSPTLSFSPSTSFTQTPTLEGSITNSPTLTPTSTFSDSPTPSQSNTESYTFTGTVTFTDSPTATESPSETPSFTDSPTPVDSDTETPTRTPSLTRTPTRSATTSRTVTPTFTQSKTFTISPTMADKTVVFEIKAFYPNPMSDHGTLYYTLEHSAQMEICIYNV